MRHGNGGGENASSNPGYIKAKELADEKYQTHKQLEFILRRPDTYVGSVVRTESNMWVLDKDTKQMVCRKITYVPGLCKIFDEILVGDAGNRQADEKDDAMTYLKVTVDRAAGEISVENDGHVIPVMMHNKEAIYVPQIIFGHLLTGFNYDDNGEQTVGGRHGYGIRLCNVFSTQFTVEIQDSENGKRYKQTWTDNMTTMGKPQVSDSKTANFTRITFKPDIAKFDMPAGIDNDMECILYRRVYDLAATVPGIKCYCEMYTKTMSEKRSAEKDSPESWPVIFDDKSAHPDWDVAFAVSDGSFQQVSFVNDIATTEGGTHVEYIADQVTESLLNALNATRKGHALKKKHIRKHIFIFVNCVIKNPVFASPTKEQLITKVSQFGSKCLLTNDFLNKIAASDGLQNLQIVVKRKVYKPSRIGQARLVDAHLAGTRRSHECTLIVTQGDSAKALAVCGRAALDPDRIGVFPLREKMLNVRAVSLGQIAKNEDIQNLKRFLGLKDKKSYTDTSGFRYGHLMIMADGDCDGNHFKGLLIGFFQALFPSLLQIPGFLFDFVTPAVKVWQGSNPKMPRVLKNFFNLAQYNEWKEAHTTEMSLWHIKHHKGLGSSSNEDARVYFTDFIPGTYLDYTARSITYDNFVNQELIQFGVANNVRCIPSMVDGLKPGQHKVLYTCFKRNLTKDLKVSKLAGYISEQTAYDEGEGEVSLEQTIIGLAQTFAGSNNVNCLEPSGNFGSRLAGGSDAASSRYLRTRLSPFARKVFSVLDEPVLESQYDEECEIEPQTFAPVIPMILVNGADGVGTGWGTSIPNYNPMELVDSLRRRMGRLYRDNSNGVETNFQPIQPWFRGWKGVTEPTGSGRYTFNGTIKWNENTPNEVVVTELPIRTWTDDYKARLEDIIGGTKGPAFIKDYKEFNDHETVRFEIQLDRKQVKNPSAESLRELLELNKKVTTTNLVAFDTRSRIRKYARVEDILEEFYHFRLDMYSKRKSYWLGVFHAEHRKLQNQARFVQEVISGAIVISKRNKQSLVEDLKEKRYEAFLKGKTGEKLGSNDEDSDASGNECDGDYDYLLSMPIWSLTQERLDKLNEEFRKKKEEHDALDVLSDKDLWCRDLDQFAVEWYTQLDADGPTNMQRMGRRA
ncbi:DNA topoisomerase II [Dactylonectria estremocensis]|uniref:DNA topoisomerase 2 n=1 Tax=Dactylonectria estremocensis TaxID=1079267 RepID=A0A9P9J9X6_9HYPO|nr:DNA topoisomerase II [Dactylonectria estremocensis]